MSWLAMMCLVGVLITVVGHFRRRIEAMERNPSTRVRIIPRTMYDDMLGLNWISEAG